MGTFARLRSIDGQECPSYITLLVLALGWSWRTDLAETNTKRHAAFFI